MTGYRIAGLEPARFAPLYGLSDAELAARQAVRVRSDAPVGFPCRVGLDDVEAGADLILVHYEHQPAATPYRASHAIFVREGATAAARYENAVPAQLARRLLSVRAFDERGMMTDADVIEGRELEPLIARFFADRGVAYLHAHNARPGCFAARIDRLG